MATKNRYTPDNLPEMDILSYESTLPKKTDPTVFARVIGIFESEGNLVIEKVIYGFSHDDVLMQSLDGTYFVDFSNNREYILPFG